MRLTIGACIVASAIGLTATAAFSNAADDLGPGVPLAKAQTYNTAPVVAPSTLDLSGTGATIQAATADVGDGATVALVKTAVPVLLTADTAIGRMPDLATAQRLANVTAHSTVSLISSALTDVWAPDKLLTQVYDWVAGNLQAAADAAYIPYSDNSFVVTDWQGVTIDGSGAHVKLVGHDRYLLPSGWQDDPDRQWQIDLDKNEAGTWLLDTVKSVDIPDADSSADQTDDHTGTAANDDALVSVDPTDNAWQPTEPDTDVTVLGGGQ